MAIRYRGKVATPSGTIYTLHIHDTDFTGSITDIELRTPGFSLAYHGGEDIFTPIVPSTVTVPWLITSSAMTTVLGLMMREDEGRFRLVIRKGSTDISPLFWVGIITQDNLRILDQPEPYDVELRAVDGLQLLSKQAYTVGANNQLFVRHLIDILKLCGTYDLFTTNGTAVDFLRTLPDVAPDVASAADPIENVKLDGEFYDTSTNQYTAFDYDAEQWLNNLCRCYNSRVFLAEGAFTFQPIGIYVNAVAGSRTYQKWQSDYSSGTDEVVSTLKVLGNDGTNGYRPTGWERTLLPPLRQVRRPMVYGDGLIATNMPGFGASIYPQGANETDTVAGYTINTPRTYKQGTQFKLSGEAVVIVGYTSDTPHLGLLRVGVKIKVGDKYCRRQGLTLNTDTALDFPADELEDSSSAVEYYDWNPAEEPQWSDNSSHLVQFGSEVINYNPVAGYAGGQGTTILTVPLNFDTPELPADATGTVQVQFQCSLFNPDGTAASAARKDDTPVIIRFRFSAGGGQSVSAHYVATNTNGATEVRQEEPVFFGSELVAAGETIFNPSEFFNVNGSLPDWVSALTTTAADLHDICTKDIAQYFEAPKEIYTGAYISNTGFIAPHIQWYNPDNLRNYLAASLTFHASEDTHELELHETGKSGSPTGGVVVYANPKPPTFGVSDVTPVKQSVRRFIDSAQTTITDLETDVVAITRQPDGSGGASSIAISDLSEVKISGPVDGQILEYNDTAERWVNVTPTGGGTDNSLSEADQTLGADREIDLNGNVLTVTDGTTDRLVISDANGVQVYGDFKVDSGAVAGASIKLEEADLLGQNYIELKAPISVTADTTLTLPDGAGSSGQVLSTNGTGTLSWVTRISDQNPLVKGALTIARIVAGNTPKLYIKGEDDLAGVFLQVPEAISTDVTFTLPGTDGTSGQSLTTNGSGVLSWDSGFSYITLQSSFYAADGNGDYIPIGGTLSETTSSNYYTIWTAPQGGEVVKATCIVSATTAGSTQLRIRKYPVPTWIDTDTQTFSSTLTTGTFTFSTATFSAGDRLQFWFDPTGRPNGVQITLLIKLYH